MKKQIFILAFVVLAIFAGGSKSYGQAVAGSAPRGIGCVDDALHPMAGKEYTYTAASNQAGNYTFWATKDANFISTAAGPVTTTNMAATKLTTPTDLLTAVNYATPSATDNVKITWSDATLFGTTVAAPTFVVVNQDGTCANNLKVWSIIPTVAFTVDIKNIDHTNVATSALAYDAAESQCMDAVRGAVYNAGTVNYNYGTQTLYWEVIAANFTVEYTPTFEISGLGNGQTATIEWAIDRAFTAPTAAVAISNGTPVTSATKVTTALTNTATGVSIYVRVKITNNTFEGINSTPITLAVDGQNSVGVWDIDNGDGTTCVLAAAADKKDVATQTLNPRPTVTSTTLGVAPNANPGLYLPVNSTN